MNKLQKAQRLAIEALQARRRKYAFDANSFLIGWATGPHFEVAAKHYNELGAAITALGGVVLTESERLDRLERAGFRVRRAQAEAPQAMGPVQLDLFGEGGGHV